METVAHPRLKDISSNPPTLQEALLAESSHPPGPTLPIIEPSEELCPVPPLDEELVDYGTHDDDDEVVPKPDGEATSSAANFNFSTLD